MQDTISGEGFAMIDIEDKLYQPSVEELIAFVNKPLFGELCETMEREYEPRCHIEYSGEKGYSGWNLKFKKAGRTLCTVYPRPGCFRMLLVVGPKEKERVETLLPTFSAAFRERWNGTRELMGQRWMMLDFDEPSEEYGDALRIIRIRRESKR
jgi:hypothetical protein